MGGPTLIQSLKVSYSLGEYRAAREAAHPFAGPKNKRMIVYKRNG